MACGCRRTLVHVTWPRRPAAAPTVSVQRREPRRAAQASPSDAALAAGFRGRLSSSGKKKMSRLKRIILRERAANTARAAAAAAGAAAAAAAAERQKHAGLSAQLQARAGLKAGAKLVTRACGFWALMERSAVQDCALTQHRGLQTGRR